MISLRLYFNSVLLVLAGAPFLLGADGSSQAQTSTSDQPTVIPFQAPSGAQTQAPQSGGELAYQLQIMQQDIRDLRGMVEDLQHQIKQIQSTQQDRYLDLDNRIQNLQQQLNQGAGGPAHPLSSVPSTASSSKASGAGNASSSTTSGNAQSLGENAMYEGALDLIRKRQYNSAITQLQAVIAKYPSGELTSNAYYWLGEVYAALPSPDYDKSRQALTQVTTYFPNSRKVPDAMYKLGKVYFFMGECKRSVTTLNQVIKNYPGKSVAKLAASFLHDNANCKD